MSSIERVPPHHQEAEMSVLGAMLLDRDIVSEVMLIVNESDFYLPRHRLIFAAIASLGDKNLAIDYITLSEELTRRNQLEASGGKEYLIEVEEAVPSSAHALEHAKIVRESAMLRRLIHSCQDIVEGAYSKPGEVEEYLDIAEQKVFEIAGAAKRTEPKAIGEILQEVFKGIDFRDPKSRHTGLETGYFDLDNMTGGLNPGDLVIIAGRPSMGKSAFALNMVEHVALKENKGVAFFSLEMSSQQIVQRMLCSRARINSHRLREGRLTHEESSKLAETASELSQASIFIDDLPGLSALQIRAKARRLKSRKNIGLLIVDYLQLMESPQAESRQQEISVISRRLKALARELEIPVIALSQLNRAADNRDDKRPKLADLRESGAIEQDADVVMMLYREEYYYPDREHVKGKAEVHIAKQRNGPTGVVTLSFLANSMRFENLATMVESHF